MPETDRITSPRRAVPVNFSASGVAYTFVVNGLRIVPNATCLCSITCTSASPRAIGTPGFSRATTAPARPCNSAGVNDVYASIRPAPHQVGN